MHRLKLFHPLLSAANTNIFTTQTLPVSKAAFQFNPQSLRFIFALIPHAATGWPFRKLKACEQYTSLQQSAIFDLIFHDAG